MPPPEEELNNVFAGGDVGEKHPPVSDIATCTHQFFQQSTINLILTGHKPQGDMPNPIRINNNHWIISADTSYSGNTKWFHDDRNATTPIRMEQLRELQGRKRSTLGRGNSVSFRGEAAVSEVLVELGKGGESLESVRYHGVLSDGTEYETVNLLGGGDDDDVDGGVSSIGSIGQVAPTSMVPDPSDSPHGGRWWTKGICRDGSRLYYAGEGYNVWNYIVSPDLSKDCDSTTTGIDSTTQ